MKEAEFEKMFDQYYDQAIKEIKGIPDSLSSWEKVKHIVDMKKVRQRRLNRLNIAAIILLSICFGAVISNSPQVVKAFSIIVQKIINFEDGSIGFLFGSPSSPASREETEEQHISMEGVERHEVRVKGSGN